MTPAGEGTLVWEDENAEDLAGELVGMRMTLGAVHKQLLEKRSEVTALNRKVEAQAAEIAKLRELNKQVTSRYVHLAKVYDDDKREVFENAVQMTEMIKRSRKNEAALVAACNTLVHDWLSDEQREALAEQNTLFHGMKRVTLERRTAQGLRSTE